MSIGTPRRPARFLTKRFSGTSCCPTGEPMRFGEIELTRIPSGASCTAIERVKLSTPALAVGAGAVPNAAQTNIHRQIPLFFGDIENCLMVGPRGIVDQDVDTAELFHDGLYHAVDGGC